MIGLIMKKEGFETLTAENGQDFLDKLDGFQPDIVTLDVMMPDLTTEDILEQLKEKTCNPKIILLTVVRYSEEEKQRIFQRGNVVDYLTKPFEIGLLLATIHKHLLLKTV